MKRFKYFNNIGLKINLISIITVSLVSLLVFTITYSLFRTILFERITVLYGFLLIITVTIIFIFILIFALRKVIDPFFKKLVYNDFLTGLPNRLAFEERIKEYESNLNENKNVTLIVYNLNEVKNLNNTYGRSFGDDYIKKTAQFIRKPFKQLGEVYRVGGDEISILVVGHTEDEVQDVLTRLQFDGEKVVIKNQPFDTAYGVATFDPTIDRSIHDMYNRVEVRKQTETGENTENTDDNDK